MITAAVLVTLIWTVAIIALVRMEALAYNNTIHLLFFLVDCV